VGLEVNHVDLLPGFLWDAEAMRGTVEPCERHLVDARPVGMKW
jgi:hypothetical protein